MCKLTRMAIIKCFKDIFYHKSYNNILCSCLKRFNFINTITNKSVIKLLKLNVVKYN